MPSLPDCGDTEIFPTVIRLAISVSMHLQYFRISFLSFGIFNTDNKLCKTVTVVIIYSRANGLICPDTVAHNLQNGLFIESVCVQFSFEIQRRRQESTTGGAKRPLASATICTALRRAESR